VAFGDIYYFAGPAGEVWRLEGTGVIAATELVPDDLDSDLTAFSSTRVLVDRDGEVWELHVPHPGGGGFGSFSRRG
jgi:hypothetical protein